MAKEKRKEEEMEMEEANNTEEENFSCGDKVSTFLAVMMSFIAVFDVCFSIFNIGKSAATCAKGRSLDWRVILLFSNTLLLIVNNAICAIFTKHALFLDQPLLFLIYCLVSWKTSPEDGLKRNCMRSYRERMRRQEIKEQVAVCTLVAAFFASCRAAVMVNLVFQVGAKSVGIIINTILVLIFYLRLFFTQCLFCMAFHRLKIGFGKALVLGCVFVYAMIIGLPVLVSFLIKGNLNTVIPDCGAKNATQS